MDCKEYKRLYSEIYGVRGISQEESVSDKFIDWSEHSHECNSCSDWSTANAIRENGFNPDQYPCVHIGAHLAQTCDEHPDPHDCTRTLLGHSPKFDEYYIYDRNMESPASYTINYCPWCGVKLPESKKNRWFRELEELGFEDALFDENIPEEYKTDRLYKGFH